VTRFEPLHLTSILCNVNHNVIVTVIETYHVGVSNACNEMNTFIFPTRCFKILAQFDKSNGKQIKENYDENQVLEIGRVTSTVAIIGIQRKCLKNKVKIAIGNYALILMKNNGIENGLYSGLKPQVDERNEVGAVQESWDLTPHSLNASKHVWQ